MIGEIASFFFLTLFASSSLRRLRFFGNLLIYSEGLTRRGVAETGGRKGDALGRERKRAAGDGVGVGRGGPGDRNLWR